jgi:transcriptional regulator with XRE-family HTH domain
MDEFIDRSINERFKEFLDRKRISHTAFAMEYGVSQPTVWAWANGKNSMPADAISYCVSRLGMDPIWAITGKSVSLEMAAENTYIFVEKVKEQNRVLLEAIAFKGADYSPKAIENLLSFGLDDLLSSAEVISDAKARSVVGLIGSGSD